MMVLADLSPADAGEEGLGLIGASSIEAVGHRMVDPTHLPVSVQAIPGGCLVCMHDTTSSDDLPDNARALSF